MRPHSGSWGGKNNEVGSIALGYRVLTVAVYFDILLPLEAIEQDIITSIARTIAPAHLPANILVTLHVSIKKSKSAGSFKKFIFLITSIKAFYN